MVEIVEIETGEAFAFLKQIQEFTNPFISESTFYDRLSKKRCLLLGAKLEGKVVGCKIGYELNDSEFYTWMGGVLPEFRKQKIARKLAEVQEKWVLEMGYKTVKLKTRNKHKNMLLFAIQDGFEIIGFEPKSEITENRIILKKTLV